MKKRIIIVIVLLFIPLSINAEETTLFSLNEVNSSPGSTVTVKLNIANNPKFGVLTSRIKYDNNKLEYISGKLDGFKYASIKGIDNSKNKGLVAIYAISIGNKFVNTGDIAILEFKINDSIKDKIDIPLTLEVKDYGINEDKSLKYNIKNGVIHVNNNTEINITNNKESIKEKYKEKLNEKIIKQENTESDVKKSENGDNITKVDDGAVDLKDGSNETIKDKDKGENKANRKKKIVKNNKKESNIKHIIIIISIIIVIAIFSIIYRRKNAKK